MMEYSTLEKESDNLVSIIIPIYNRERTLDKLFISLSQISYSPIEIILIDNHSQDHSLYICQEFQKRQTFSEKLTVIVDEEKTPGACAARNKGISLANGSYLYFFDSDDEISPDFFDNLMPYFPRFDVVCAPTLMYFENGTKKERVCIPTNKPYDHILSASLSTQSFIIKKKLIVNIGNWDENLRRWNDWELGVRILCHQPQIKWLPERSYHKIHQHHQSISGKSFTEDYQYLLDSLKKAEQDILLSQLPNAIKIKSIKALIGKYILLSSNIFKEGNKTISKEIYRLGVSKTDDSIFKIQAALLYFLSNQNVPGIWRLFRFII